MKGIWSEGRGLIVLGVQRWCLKHESRFVHQCVDRGGGEENFQTETWYVQSWGDEEEPAEKTKD